MHRIKLISGHIAPTSCKSIKQERSFQTAKPSSVWSGFHSKTIDER